MQYMKRFLTIGLCLAVLAGCAQKEEVTTSERQVSVKAAVVKASNRDVVSEFSGSLEGERQGNLYAKIAESVDSVWVDEGDKVVRDQVLVSFDPTGSTSGFNEARSNFENAAKQFDKMKELYNQGAISELEYDNAETSYEVSRATYDAASKLVFPSSPINGYVTSVDVTAGDFVNVGQRLATVATRDRLRVKFEVNTSDVTSLAIGREVRISNDAVKGSATGRITAIASSADPSTRSYEVEAIIDNHDQRFSPGMFVHVQYIQESLTGVLAIPVETVLTLDNKSVVYLSKEGRAEMREVTLGAILGGEVVVTDGLSAGDTIITLGQQYLEDGLLLNITDVAE